MDALQFYVVFFISIWVLALLFKDKLKIDVHGPLIMRRTKRMRGFIDNMAQKRFNIKQRNFTLNLGIKKFDVEIGPTVSPWRVITNAGIPVSFFIMFSMLALLIWSLKDLFVAPQVSLIIPGVNLPGSTVSFPLEYSILGLITVLVVHEFGHGILARVEGVRIKSIGVLLLGILPGAFVEPDEEDIEKVKRSSKLRIYAAGSVFNLLLCVVAFLGFFACSYAITSDFEVDGIQISSIAMASPATGVLESGMVIQSINGHPTKNLSEYIKAAKNIKIGDTVTIQTDQGIKKLKTVKNPNNASRPYIGIFFANNPVIKEDVANVFGNQLPWIWVYLYNLFQWIAILNFAIGTINLLPARPLDGGLMFEELLRYKLSEERVKPIINTFSLVVILILAISILYGLGRGIFLML
jgi:membrane-associated protease RseP (regulator of RpoE activity)